MRYDEWRYPAQEQDNPVAPRSLLACLNSWLRCQPEEFTAATAWPCHLLSQHHMKLLIVLTSPLLTTTLTCKQSSYVVTQSAAQVIMQHTEQVYPHLQVLQQAKQKHAVSQAGMLQDVLQSTLVIKHVCRSCQANDYTDRSVLQGQIG